MTDEDITRLASKLTQSLATKDDITGVKNDINEVKDNLREVKNELKNDIRKLENKIDELDDKANIILKFADGVNEKTIEHDKRLKALEVTSLSTH